MEQNSPHNLIDSQIRDCFTRVVWTQKTHEKCADILLERLNLVRNIQIGLSVLITSGVLYTVFGKNNFIAIITAVLSVILFGLNIFVRNKNYGVVAEKHTQAAKELWNVRESYLSLITDMAAEKISLKKALESRDSLQDKLHTIYKGSPRTFSKGYDQASDSLKNNEELTVHDSETNAFLPELLRKK